MKVLVTGANGFVGRHLVPQLSMSHDVAVAERKPTASSLKSFTVGDIGADTDWGLALTDIDVVVHLAARVHVMNETASDPLEAFKAVNTAGTQRLAEASVRQGVKKLVFLSSIKVNGERTTTHPFESSDDPDPRDPYAISKLEAEEALLRATENSSTEAVILRSPVIYGTGVGGNIARIAQAIKKGVPLPLGNVDNRRTMLSVDNLTKWITAAAEEPTPRNPVLMGDPSPISTRDLVRHLADGMNRSPRLFSVPLGGLRLGARLLGREAFIDRLVDNLEITPEWGAFQSTARSAFATPDVELRRLGTSFVEEASFVE